MIGTVEEARLVAEWPLECYSEDCYEWILPDESWSLVGEGCNRLAILSPSGVVYKRQLSTSKSDNSNMREFENILRAIERPIKGWRVPESQMYSFENTDIIAMEYIVGTHDTQCNRAYRQWDHKCNCTGACTAEKWEQVEALWGITDVHPENIIVEYTGIRVLIDLAE